MHLVFKSITGNAARASKYMGKYVGSAATTADVVKIARHISNNNPSAAAASVGEVLGGTLANFAIGAVVGGVLGIETGPFAVFTSLVGGIICARMGKTAGEKHLTHHLKRATDFIHGKPPIPNITHPEKQSAPEINKSTFGLSH